jgi:hypothetical protein
LAAPQRAGRARSTICRARVPVFLLVATQFNPLHPPVLLATVATVAPKKLALTTCMRKLLILLKAIAHRGVPWRRPTSVAVPCAVI